MLSLLLLMGLLRQAPLASARQEPLPAPVVIEDVTLGALHASPARRLGREVRFRIQFEGLVESWDPFLSRFDSARWLGIEAWPDEAFTWDKAVFDNPVGRLFVRRGGGFEPVLRRARKYQRLEVHGRVREVFLGEPWIEILELTPLEGEVGEGTILHVTHARELLFEGQFTLALEQYERARAAPLPPHALAAVLNEIALVEETQKRNEEQDSKTPRDPHKAPER